MISAFDAIRAINRQRNDALVVYTMSPVRYWDAVSTEPDLDLPIFGGMGKACSVGLGLALAQPSRKVIILEGDGGLLMNLGTLVTIAGQEPENLVYFAFDDGVYNTTGGQPVPGGGKHDLAGIARESGISESYGFDNLEDFATALPDLLQKKGPVFVSLKVEHSPDIPEFYAGSTGAAMKRLSAKLGER
jgi:thiamine pyrophosphate-dependent acetolactate synthase large subunit-like protein